MTKTILLTQGKTAIVDDDDYKAVSSYVWYYDAGYAVRNVRIDKSKRVRERMHRFVLGKNGDLEIDHIDGNGLNNKKSNLRFVSRAQNQMNSRSRSEHYKGVVWHPKTGKWRARITVDGKRLSLGLFSTDEEAAKAYDNAARIHFGEYARTNF